MSLHTDYGQGGCDAWRGEFSRNVGALPVAPPNFANALVVGIADGQAVVLLPKAVGSVDAVHGTFYVAGVVFDGEFLLGATQQPAKIKASGYGQWIAVTEANQFSFGSGHGHVTF